MCTRAALALRHETNLFKILNAFDFLSMKIQLVHFRSHHHPAQAMPCGVHEGRGTGLANAGYSSEHNTKTVLPWK